MILSQKSFSSKWTAPLLGIFDLDLVMVNQIMHTFTRQAGFMKNNMTDETWSWQKDSFEQQTHRGVSFNELIQLLGSKLSLIVGCLIGFAIISCINGFVVRIALTTANAIILPLLWIMRKCFGIRESDRNM